MARWSRRYKWCGSTRGETIFQGTSKNVLDFFVQIHASRYIGLFCLLVSQHIKNVLLCLLESVSTCGHRNECMCVCVCLLYSTEVCLPPTAWQLCCAKFQAAPHSPHMAPRGSPTSTPGYLKRKENSISFSLKWTWHLQLRVESWRKKKKSLTKV